MKKIVSGKQIVKVFGTGDERRRVLDDVSVTINAGEFVAVMGPSGSGKSTLLFALSGTDDIDEGKVIFDGKDLSQLNENALADLRRTKMGFVFQQPTLLKNLSILDNIILPAMRDNRKNAAMISEKARMLMEKTGIAGLEKRDITEVSGGQLQRAGICRSLINSPAIIFGDEPTGALNSRTGEEIIDLFAEMNADGTAVMLVTHDPKVAARAGRVLFMRDGRLTSELVLSRFAGVDMERRIRTVLENMQEIGI